MEMAPSLSSLSPVKVSSLIWLWNEWPRDHREREITFGAEMFLGATTRARAQGKKNENPLTQMVKRDSVGESKREREREGESEREKDG